MEVRVGRCAAFTAVRSRGSGRRPGGRIAQPIRVRASGRIRRAFSDPIACAALGSVSRNRVRSRPCGVPRFARMVGRRFGPVPHGAGNNAGGLRGCILECIIVEVGVNRRGFTLAVPEQPPDGGQADAVHDALRSPGVPAIVDANTGQSGFIPDAHPECVEPTRREFLGKHSRCLFRLGQCGEHAGGFLPEPERTRSGLGVFEPRARAVLAQFADVFPFEI